MIICRILFLYCMHNSLLTFPPNSEQLGIYNVVNVVLKLHCWHTQTFSVQPRTVFGVEMSKYLPLKYNFVEKTILKGLALCFPLYMISRVNLQPRIIMEFTRYRYSTVSKKRTLSKQIMLSTSLFIYSKTMHLASFWDRID